jgi:hypothetical protein
VPMTNEGLNKLVEEMGELLQVVGKMLAYGDGLHPDGTILMERFIEEAGDVSAALEFVVVKKNVEHSVGVRANKKLDIFYAWDADPNL